MINRIDCYKVLFEMKKQGIDVDNEIRVLSTSALVPKSIILFINEKRPMKTTEFYETLRKKNNRKASKLYKNIVSENLEPIEALKTASSLLTQIIIASEKLDISERESFFNQTRASNLSEALTLYFSNGDIKKTLEELKYVKDDIKIFEDKGE